MRQHDVLFVSVARADSRQKHSGMTLNFLSGTRAVFPLTIRGSDTLYRKMVFVCRVRNFGGLSELGGDERSVLISVPILSGQKSEGCAIWGSSRALNFAGISFVTFLSRKEK